MSKEVSTLSFLHRFKGRALAVSVVALTAAGVVGLTPFQASAVAPSAGANLHPDDTYTAASRKANILSDRFDGVDSLAHITSIASTDTQAVEYFVCPTAFSDPGDPTTGASGCQSIGVDTTGVKPNVPVANSQAFDILWDIPPALDTQTRDIVAWMCSQANSRILANCFSRDEDNTQLDDSSTGGGLQTTAGEIVSPTHGQALSNSGPSTFVARTSTDVNSLGFCWDLATASSPPAGGCDFFDAVGAASTTTATYKEWTLTFGAGFTLGLQNQQFELAIIELTSNTEAGNVCSGDATDCQLDAHFIATGPPTPTAARMTFGTSATCNAANSPPAVTSVTDQAGNHEIVRLCVFDQFNNNITNQIDTALQVTPVDSKRLFNGTADPTGFDSGVDNGGVFTGHPGSGTGVAGEGTEHDTNVDNYFEQVDGDPGNAGGSGTLDNSVEFHATGQYTITGCYDSNNDAEFAPGPGSPTPCSGETVSASLTKTITANVIQHAHMRLTSQVQSDPTCHTGASQTSVPSGSTINVTVCGRDFYENGVAGVHIIWRLDGFGFYTATSDTTDSSGNGNATVSSSRDTVDHQATLTACIDVNNNGACDTIFGAFTEATAQFQITWTAAAPPPPGASTLTLRKEGRQNTRGPGGLVSLGGDLTGAAGSQCAGHEGGQSIKIHRGSSAWTVVASATTGTGGDYHATFKIFYRRRVAKNFVATYAGDSTNCTASTSNTVAVRGFRPN